MGPRNRAKEPVKENRQSGFRGKDPEMETLQAQRQVLVRAIRQEDAIFREHLGNDVFLEIRDESNRILATLENVGTDFVKLTNVRSIPTYHNLQSGDQLREFLRKTKLPEDTEERSLPLFSGTLPSLVLNKSKIEKMMPASDFE